jgi:hypothetical protein
MSKQPGSPPIQHAVLIQAQQQPMVVEPQMVQPQLVYAQNAQQQYAAGNSVRAWGDATQNLQQTRVLGGFATANQGSVGAIGGVLRDYHSQGAPRFADASPPFGAQPGMK